MPHIDPKLIYQTLKAPKEQEVIHLTNESYYSDSKTVLLKNKKYMSFVYCDYLGLNKDPRVLQGAEDALKHHGLFSSASRSIIKPSILTEAEEALERIFEKPCLLLPKTAMAHNAALPLLIDKKDAVLIDQQAHATIMNAGVHLKGMGVPVSYIRHNRMDLLREQLEALKNSDTNIWYLTDGVFSMYGDAMPAKELYQLMEEFSRFHVYADDAHGTSWIGEKGCGYVLNQIPYHNKLFLVTSLAKGFGASGGVLVCPNTETKDYIETCGSPFLFSGPMPTPIYGAIIESVKIHISPELPELQLDLKAKIQYFANLCYQYGLPLIQNATPILFIAAGKPEMCSDICLTLKQRGYISMSATYPAVPINNSGIRITLNCSHTYNDIKMFVHHLHEAYQLALVRNNASVQEIISNGKWKLNLQKQGNNKL